MDTQFNQIGIKIWTIVAKSKIDGNVKIRRRILKGKLYGSEN